MLALNYGRHSRSGPRGRCRSPRSREGVPRRLTDGDALLEVSNIETYYGPIMAIRGISFAVPRGQIVTILGANGAGKTTILKTVSGVMDVRRAP